MDIEGTTSNIQFVKNVLFPYSAKMLRNFISTHRTVSEVIDCLKATEQNTTEQAIEQLLKWITDDVKHPALKTLQGLIWQQGYENKDFVSHIYDDVLPTLAKWKAKNLHLG